MTITAEQAKTRKQYLGASDVAAVLGLNPYKTPADVWLEKTSDIEPSDDTEATSIGNDFERPMIAWAEARIGKPLVYSPDTSFAANGIMACHLDAQVVSEPTPVEVKCSAKTDEWGDEGTDIVPQTYLVQIHAQAICTGAEVAYLAAFLAGFRMERRLYTIPINGELTRVIEDECCAWWDKYVVTGMMPPSAPSLDVVKRIRPREGVVVEIDPALVERFDKARVAAKVAREQEDAAKAAILAAMNGAEGATCPGWVVMNKQMSRKGYVVEPTTFRQLTVKAAK